MGLNLIQASQVKSLCILPEYVDQVLSVNDIIR